MSAANQLVSSWSKIWSGSDEFHQPTNWKACKIESFSNSTYLMSSASVKGKHRHIGWGVSPSTTHHHQSHGYTQFLPYLEVKFSIILKAETPEDEVTCTRLHKKLVPNKSINNVKIRSINPSWDQACIPWAVCSTAMFFLHQPWGIYTGIILILHPAGGISCGHRWSDVNLNRVGTTCFYVGWASNQHFSMCRDCAPIKGAEYTQKELNGTSIPLQKQSDILVLLIPRSSDKRLGGLLATRALTRGKAAILSWLLTWLPVEYPSAFLSQAAKEENTDRGRCSLWIRVLPKFCLRKASF